MQDLLLWWYMEFDLHKLEDFRPVLLRFMYSSINESIKVLGKIIVYQIRLTPLCRTSLEWTSITSNLHLGKSTWTWTSLYSRLSPSLGTKAAEFHRTIHQRPFPWPMYGPRTGDVVWGFQIRFASTPDRKVYQQRNYIDVTFSSPSCRNLWKDVFSS